MKKLFCCLLVLVSLGALATRYHRHPGRQKAERHAEHIVRDLNDYVTGLSPAHLDSLERYFTSYLSNAMTYSPTKGVRKKSRSQLDAKVNKLLSPAQQEEYTVFMKDLRKKHQHMHKRHHFCHEQKGRSHGGKGHGCKRDAGEKTKEEQ